MAPLEVATWYGSSSPCSISAFCWSAVTTRGLDTTLPLPSASSAEISRFRKRLDAAPNSDSAKVAAIEAVGAGGRQIDEGRVGEVDAGRAVCSVCAPMAFMLPPTASWLLPPTL